LGKRILVSGLSQEGSSEPGLWSKAQWVGKSWRGKDEIRVPGQPPSSLVFGVSGSGPTPQRRHVSKVHLVRFAHLTVSESLKGQGLQKRKSGGLGRSSVVQYLPSMGETLCSIPAQAQCEETGDPSLKSTLPMIGFRGIYEIQKSKVWAADRVDQTVRVPAWQAWGPEFKPQYHKRK
jgi:hypothetical protein